MQAVDLHVECNSLSFQEPACPLCFEPFSTEAPDLDDSDDGEKVLCCAPPGAASVRAALQNRCDLQTRCPHDLCTS